MGSIADDLPEPPKLKPDPTTTAKPKAPVMMGGDEDDGMFKEEVVGDGDQAMAVKAFKG